MLFNDFRTFLYDSEDTGGITGDEDIEAILDQYADADEEAETPTSESEPSTEPTSEQEPVSSESDTTSESEPSQAEPTSETEPSEEPAKKLYANKYHTVEDLEAAHRESTTEARRLVEELNKLKAEQTQQQSTQEPEQEKPAEDIKAPFDMEKFNNVFYDKSPAEALVYALEQVESVSSEKHLTQQLQTSEQEAKEFNATLGQQRAKELIAEAAKRAELPEAEIAKITNGGMVTEEMLDKFPSVKERLLAEMQLVDSMFQRQPISINGKIVSNNGKYKEDVFKMANIILNHDKIVQETHLQASEDTVHAIQKAKPGAKIITPTEESRAEIGTKFTGTETSLDEAIANAETVPTEEREAILDDL